MKTMHRRFRGELHTFLWILWIKVPIRLTCSFVRLLFIGLIIGTLISEILFSGTLSDWIVVKEAKRNDNVKVPESRLWLIYPAVILSAVGLVVWGVSVDKGYHWMVGQVAFALCKCMRSNASLRRTRRCNR